LQADIVDLEKSVETLADGLDVEERDLRL